MASCIPCLRVAWDPLRWMLISCKSSNDVKIFRGATEVIVPQGNDGILHRKGALASHSFSLKLHSRVDYTNEGGSG